MESELAQRISALEAKIDSMNHTVELLRKYFLWTGIITVVLFVLPLVGLAFAIPSFLHSFDALNSVDIKAVTGY